MVMQVGERLRAARQGQGLSLRELAARADVSASLLSQIENGKVNPTVMSIYSIAAALGLPVDHFFAPEDRSRPARSEGDGATGERAAARSVAESGFGEAAQYAAAVESAVGLRHSAVDTLPAAEALRSRRTPFDPLVRRAERATIELMDGVVWARLTPTAEPAAEFLEVTYPPGATSGPAMSQHAGREFQLVLSGELTLELAFERHVLHAGDSIIFDSTVPHRLVNNGHEPMRAISVVLNP
jgi:transcriptional regulator with XRE-family HTH domain/quercetin dioxygenase-like cupin family protein